MRLRYETKRFWWHLPRADRSFAIHTGIIAYKLDLGSRRRRRYYRFYSKKFIAVALPGIMTTNLNQAAQLGESIK